VIAFSAGATPARSRYPVAPSPVVDRLLWAAVVLGYGLTLLLLWQALHWGL
jgi:hypothetical protein